MKRFLPRWPDSVAPLIVVLVAALCGAAVSAPGTAPRDLNVAFPTSATMTAVTGRSWVHFIKPASPLKERPGLRQLGYYYLDCTPGDFLADQITRATEQITENQKSLARISKQDPQYAEIAKLIADLQAARDQFVSTAASQSPYRRFVNRYFTTATLRVNLLVQWFPDDVSLDAVKTRAVTSLQDNAYTHYEVTVSRDLGLGQDSRYEITALIAKKTGQVMDRVHWAYCHIGSHWVQVVATAEAAEPDTNILALLRQAAEALGAEPLFTVTGPDGGVPAHPKNVTELTLRAHRPDGSLLADSPVVLQLAEPESPLLGGALQGAADDGHLALQTDAQGNVSFTYVPPDIDRQALPKFVDLGRGARDPIVQLLRVSSKSVSGAARIHLAWPFPHIDRFATGSGVDAGYWGKHPVQVAVSDPDSQRFTYRVVAVGQLREAVKLSAVTSSRASWEGGTELAFLYCPPRMGLDLTKLPDLRRELLVANVKFVAEYIDCVGKIPAVKRLMTDKGRAAVEAGKNLIGLGKTTVNFLQAADNLPQGGSLDDQQVAGLIKDATGLMNDLVSTADSFRGPGGPKNPTVEVGKWILTNLNTLEQAHRGNWKIATSYEDIVFLPMHLEVTDSEGHTTVALRKVGVKVARAQ